ncbi:hypothetical protein [Desulfoluna sp.]|uniref:YfaP family protein n=1 Tax=Desulfoluna sp. TaxID=2045199 RepID=UPI002635C2AD|nr:hypothetical protein [Desulfoluna sp.]
MRRTTGWVVFLSALFVAAVSFAGECACWDDRERHEVEGFSEMEGAVILSFKDAVSCEPLGEASVVLSLPDKKRQLTTGAKGYIVMPERIVDAIGEGVIGIRLSKEGYIPLEIEIPVHAGTIRAKRYLVSKALPPQSYRFVLQWDEKPMDLDLHLIKDQSVHISYRHKRSIPDLARLDRDDMDGLGPETLTLDCVKATSTYRLFVHNYSGEASLAGARVSVYADNKLDRVIPLPETNGREVNVLVIEGGKLR